MAGMVERRGSQDDEADVERSVIVSPLLNLATQRPSGATLKHSRPIVPLAGSALSGIAMLSLTPDHKVVDVRIALDRPRPVDIRLRRLEDELLLIEIVASRWSSGGSRGARRFSLEDRRTCRPFAGAAAALRDAGIRTDELGAASVEGIRVEPVRADRLWRQAAAAYSTERMLAEIAAAEYSPSAIAASRHVELAILHARRLGSAGGGLH